MVARELVIASTHEQYRLWLEDKNPREHPFIREQRSLRGYSQDMPILILHPDLGEGYTYSETCLYARAAFSNIRTETT